MARSTRRPIWRSLPVAVALIAVAWFVQVRLVGQLGTAVPYPYLIYYPAVMIAALYGGLSAGLLATALSVVLAARSWTIHVGRPFDISGLNDQLRLAIFLFNCILTSIISHVLHNARARADDKAEAERRLAAERERAVSELREREEQLRLFIEHAPAAIAMFDREMRCLAVSRRWLSDYGLLGQDVLGRSLYDVFPELPERWKEIHRRVLDGAVVRTEEDPFERADGLTQWLRWEARPWHTAAGAIGGLVVFSEDVTERKRAEEALRQAKEAWELTFASVPDLVAVLDDQHRVVRANPAMAARLGRTPEQCAGLPCYKAVHGLDRPPSYCPHLKTLADGRERSVEVYEEKLGGHFLVSATPLLDGAGRVSGSVHVARDITELKRSEEALRQAKQEVEQALSDIGFIVEATDLGLWSNEWPMSEMNWNRQVKDHFWLPPDHKPTLDDFYASLHPDDREFTRRAIEQAVAERTLLDVAYRALSSDGRQRWVRAQGRAIYGEDGQPKRFSGITQDITAQKLMEEELRRSRDELEDRVEERTRELAAKNKELQDFAYIASHDLHEPLRKVLAFGELLREEHAESLGDVGRDYLMRMERAAGRMQSLLRDLLEYSRVTTKATPFEPVNLGEVAREATLDLDRRIEETGGRIEIGELPQAEVDASQMRQVFQNLFSNALKYHGAEPPLVRASAEVLSENGREMVKISVRDNGIGFDEQFLDRIFLPFQRLHGKNAYEGTGIGLAIVRKIIERHNGTITAKSEPGKGAAFIVNLPLRQARA